MAVNPVTGRYTTFTNEELAILNSMPGTHKQLVERTGLDSRRVSRIIDKKLRYYTYWLMEPADPIYQNEESLTGVKSRVYFAMPPYGKQPEFNGRDPSELVAEYRKKYNAALADGDSEEAVYALKVLASLYKAIYTKATRRLKATTDG